MFSKIIELFQSDTKDLEQVIKNADILLDVRTKSEYELGSIDGAINIPLAELGSRFNSLDPTQSIVVFCQSGNRSGQAQRLLKDKGFDKVFNGGGWRSLKKILIRG